MDLPVPRKFSTNGPSAQDQGRDWERVESEVPNRIPKRPEDKLENPYVPVAQPDRAAVS